MTRHEWRLVLGLAVVGAFVLTASVLVAGGLLALNQGWIGVARQSTPVAVTAATSVQAQAGSNTGPSPAPTAGPSLLERLTGSSNPAQEPLPLGTPKVDMGPDLSNIYEQVNPGVVSVVVEQSAAGALPNQPSIQYGSGSGFVYDDQHIVTNNHVTSGATSIEVVFFDGERSKATVAGADVYSDLAVIRVDHMPSAARSLPVSKDLSQLKVGDPVVAIGNPFEMANSMTFGIVSAMGRTIPSQTMFSIPEAIQTDAAINPGNSGGPLLDLRGEVVGVNSQIDTNNVLGSVPANSGVGFAIPATVVNKVVPALISKGQYAWSYLGVSGNTMTADQAAAAGLSDSRGAYISCVLADGPSAGVLQGSSNVACPNGGLTSGTVPVGGDVVVAVDGQPVTSFEDLVSYIGLQTQPGQTVQLTILRSGKQQDVSVKLGTRTNQNP